MVPHTLLLGIDGVFLIIEGMIKMKKLNRQELKELFFTYFEEHGHKIIPGSSLLPENDPTVLFTTAGMHPLVPFLLGEKHPSGKRLVNIQKCVRTGDIDEVGDSCHLTFFEMMGNWSLGDYFKKESIAFSYEFLTSPKYLAIDPNRIYVTCFAGNQAVPKDIELSEMWQALGVKEDHICYLVDNFWILGSGHGPCGPDTEIFYDTGIEPCSSNCHPGCNCAKYLEIWNNVFLEYNSDDQGNLTPLSQKCVDTGMGLERILGVINNFDNIYDSELFCNSKNKLIELSSKSYEENNQSYRIIMDHLRASVFILGDNHGIAPSNIGQGYILRRLIRRAIRHLRKIEITTSVLSDIAEVIINDYQEAYPELIKNKDYIVSELAKEEIKFSKTIQEGERLFYKIIKHLPTKIIDGSSAFKLFDTFGFPIEYTIELAQENNLTVDLKGFEEKFKEHQIKSRTIDAGTFKGGLSDSSYETTKYHTLAHIMLACLQEILGPQVSQKGCNITAERIRFDFNCDHKLTDEELAILSTKVKNVISQGIAVTMTEMSYEEAKENGAHGTFEDKYGDSVKVYTIGSISKEICGGPHVSNTNELGEFRIIKEESSSAGVRRIKAILE